MSIASFTDFTNAFYGPLADKAPATQKGSLYDNILRFRGGFESNVSPSVRQALAILGITFAIYLGFLAVSAISSYCAGIILTAGIVGAVFWAFLPERMRNKACTSVEGCAKSFFQCFEIPKQFLGFPAN